MQLAPRHQRLKRDCGLVGTAIRGCEGGISVSSNNINGRRTITSGRLRSLLLCSAFIVPGFAAHAAGNNAVATLDALGGDGVETVVVTGSRIATEKAVTNSPITTLSAENIDSTGAITLESALAQLPQFTVGAGATTTGFYAPGIATLNLRGLGPVRNLVLLDGRRLQPSNSQQVVDINTIPKAIIGDVEVITGGASAVYGSDAIAGVVNFKTRKFEGVELDAEYNASQAYGGGTQDYSLTVGGNYAHDRGNALISVIYTKRDPVNYKDVDFYQTNAGQGDFRSGEGTYNPSTNRPSQSALDTLFASYGVAAGSVPTNSYLSFNSDGTLFAASNGLANFKGNVALVGGSDGNVYYKNEYLLAQTPLERYSAFAKTTYDVTSKIQTFAQFNFTDYTSTTLAEPGNTTITIPVTNPFIPAALATLLASRADPTAPLLLEKRFYEAGARINNREFNVFQALGGFSGAIDAIDGNWEVYASHGETKVTQISPGSVVKSKLTTLLNAADGGASICDGGYNPFNITTLSDSCYNYLVASPQRRTSLTQDVVEANVQGHAFSLPAGDIHFAAGASYKGNTYTFKPDSDVANGTTVGVPSAGASSGATHVFEYYGELLVPVLKDLPLVKEFNLDAAYRYSHYNLSGGTNTYKADANWLVVDGLRLRGGYQRAVRAPNVGELFIAPSSDSAAIGELAAGGGDPCAYNSGARSSSNASQIKNLCVGLGVPASLIDTFTNAQNDIPATNTGNTALKPETADTFTIGAVLTSPFASEALSHALVSFDYYNIALKDGIGVISGLTALNKCFNLDGSNPTYSALSVYCGLLTRNTTTGRIDSVLQPTLNLGAYRTSGLDIEASWQSGLGALGLSDSYGTVGFNTAINYLLGYKVQSVSGGSWADYANTVGSAFNGDVGSLPRLKAVTSLSYGLDDYGAGFTWRHLSHLKSVDKVSNPSSTTPDTGSFDAIDFFANWKINDQLTFSGGLTNLFDRDPPVVDGVAGNTEASTYDTLGRSFYVRLKASL